MAIAYTVISFPYVDTADTKVQLDVPGVSDLVLVGFSVIQHEGQWVVIAAFRPKGTDVP